MTMQIRYHYSAYLLSERTLPGRAFPQRVIEQNDCAGEYWREEH